MPLNLVRISVFLLNKIHYEIDAISINSDNVIQSTPVTNVKSTRQRNPSVSSSSTSVNQEILTTPRG
jgi:hypothetical protein